MLVEDVKQIEEGHVPLPNYTNNLGYTYIMDQDKRFLLLISTSIYYILYLSI
jgi:hypothetical protein